MPLDAANSAIVPRKVDREWRHDASGPIVQPFTGNLPRGSALIRQRQEDLMFGWAIAFLVIALIAGLLGFGVVAGTAFAAAKIIFVVALIAFLISGVLGIAGRSLP
jgi:uncharacterized membrane protein YtjA (UPF0391 family)